MKTKEKVLKNGMAETLDEVIFANRNHAYGAFELRRKYNKHLLLGFIFGFFVFATGISVPLIQSLFGNEAFRKPPEPDVTVSFTELPDQNKIELPKPPDIPIETKTSVFRVVVVDSVPSGEDTPMSNEEALENTDNEYTDLAYVPENKPGNKIFDENEDAGMVVVEENATFMGGDLKVFQAWLQSNMTYPSAAEQAGIEGKVYIQFAVNSKGNVCDALITRGLHPSINDECIRVLLSSPKWTPAKQNGNTVKQKFSLNVVFQLTK